MESREQNKVFGDVIHTESGQWISIIQIQMKKAGKSLYGSGALTNPDMVRNMVYPVLGAADREKFAVISLDIKLYPIAFEVTAIGGINHCAIDIPNLFKHAILSNAAHILCIHNHPSGDPSPSKEDLLVTMRMKQAGNLLGISLVDHIIIAGDSYYSFKEQGKLEWNREGEAA